MVVGGFSKSPLDPHHWVTVRFGREGEGGELKSTRDGRARHSRNSDTRRTPASTRLDGSDEVETRWSEPSLAAPNPRRALQAAEGQRISPRWALNSRFCRAMKMSRLINTSGPLCPFSFSNFILPPPRPPPADNFFPSRRRLATTRSFFPPRPFVFEVAFFFSVGPLERPKCFLSFLSFSLLDFPRC